MSLCDKCVHCNVCGNEDAREKIGKASPFLYVCDDFILSVPEREKETDADIMKCARAMKEYCENYAENCEGCPFKSKKVNVWCELGASTLPCDWDLPEREKEGE